MKKFIFMIALVFAAITMQSCKDTPQFGIDYSVTVTGDADGDVAIRVPVGTIGLNGTADVDVHLANNYVFGEVENSTDLVLGEAVNANDEKVAETAKDVSKWVDDNITVELDTTKAQGSYYLLVDFRVRERVTGLTFSGKKEFTNRTTPPNAE